MLGWQATNIIMVIMKRMNLKLRVKKFQEMIICNLFLETQRNRKKSHAPIVIYRNTIGDKTKKPGSGEPLAPGYTILDESTEVNNVCCDQIHIVFGDFDAGAK